MEKLRTGIQQLRHLPQLQCDRRSLGSSVLVTVASGSVLYLSHASPHLLCGTDPAIKRVQHLGVQVFNEILGLGCSRCRSIVELLTAFWSLLVAPRWRPLHWQLLPRSRKRGDLRELHGLWSFGCIREPFGQRRIREPFGQRRGGEVKAGMT